MCACVFDFATLRLWLNSTQWEDRADSSSKGLPPLTGSSRTPQEGGVYHTVTHGQNMMWQACLCVCCYLRSRGGWMKACSEELWKLHASVCKCVGKGVWGCTGTQAHTTETVLWLCLCMGLSSSSETGWWDKAFSGNWPQPERLTLLFLSTKMGDVQSTRQDITLSPGRPRLVCRLMEVFNEGLTQRGSAGDLRPLLYSAPFLINQVL